jgi:hypothetical protein
VNTGGYGGKQIRESVNLKTNDPNQPWIEVAVTGMVEKVVEIRPERVRLKGPAGTSLFAEVEIIPRKEFPLTVGQIRVKNGEFIRYEVTERCTDGKNRCVIRVENTRTERGEYFDALYVHTDSKVRPSIPIYITGMIR